MRRCWAGAASVSRTVRAATTTFNISRFPGANLCLGTDSLASVRKVSSGPIELNLFEEMKTLACQAPGLPPAAILKMATVNGAQALGRSGAVGQLSENALADLIAIPFAGTLPELDSAVIHHAGDVAASMIGGQWALGPNRN